jgi:hypothetical protein
MAVPTWVPLFVLLGGLFSVYSCMYPTVAQSQLSVICVELGYPEDCNFKEATRKSSEWSAYVNFITGVLMCGVIGLWTASSDRVGRRWTLLLPSIGTFAMLVSWMLVLWFDSIYEHWRIPTFAGTVVNTLTGSYAMALLSIFGQCGDLTTLDPQSRGTYSRPPCSPSASPPHAPPPQAGYSCSLRAPSVGPPSWARSWRVCPA